MTFINEVDDEVIGVLILQSLRQLLVTPYRSRMSVEDAIRNLHIHQKCIFPVVKGEVEVCEDNVDDICQHVTRFFLP